MFQLHKAAIIRPYVSENVKKKIIQLKPVTIDFIIICMDMVVYFSFYIFWYIWPDGRFVQLKLVDAIGFAVIKVVCWRTLLL